MPYFAFVPRIEKNSVSDRRKLFESQIMSVEDIVKVFASLQVLEGAISLALGVLHVVGFMNPNEPTTHQPFFLVTFFGFLALSLVGSYRLIRHPINFKVQASTAAIGFIVFIATSICSMADVENDQHLQSMTDIQEWQHPYFQINLYQSVISLINALTFLMRFMFSVEFIMKPSKGKSNPETEKDEDFGNVFKPLELHFFPGRACTFIRRKLWNSNCFRT